MMLTTPAICLLYAHIGSYDTMSDARICFCYYMPWLTPMLLPPMLRHADADVAAAVIYAI